MLLVDLDRVLVFHTYINQQELVLDQLLERAAPPASDLAASGGSVPAA